MDARLKELADVIRQRMESLNDALLEAFKNGLNVDFNKRILEPSPGSPMAFTTGWQFEVKIIKTEEY